MRVVVFPQPGRVEEREVARPLVRPGQVLVETRFSAISAGTELLVLDGSLPGVYGGVVRYPLVPGYENVGQIVEIGAGVSGRREGDWVVCEGAVSFPGLHSCWGGHSEYVLAPADEVFALPGGIEPEIGVFMVLTSIALHALQRSRLSLGDDVAIFGQGVVGLLALQIAKAMGARTIVAVDRISERLRASADLGATATICAQSVDESQTRLSELSAGRGFDVVVDASGSAELAGAAARVCCERGRLVLAGMYTQPVTFDYWDLYARELDVLPSRQSGPKQELPDPYYRWTWRRTNEQSLQLLASGDVSVDGLITHRLPVERAVDGYDVLRSQPEVATKVLFEWR